MLIHVGDCDLGPSVYRKYALRFTMQPAIKVGGPTLPGRAFSYLLPFNSAPPFRGAFSLSGYGQPARNHPPVGSLLTLTTPNG